MPANVRGFLADVRENGVPLAWCAIALLLFGGTFLAGFMLGGQRYSNDFQRGLEAGVKMRAAHPDLLVSPN